MSFQGDVAGIGLGELLQGLARGGREGVLRLHSSANSTSLGLQAGQIHLLPEPDEEPEIWRRRSERAWVKDPDHRIDRLRMAEIAYSERLEVCFRLLDAEGVHFRFEPRPLSLEDDAREMDEEGLRSGETAPIRCPPISVEFLLLEHARLSDECLQHGDSRLLSPNDMPRMLHADPPTPEFEKFWREADGISSIQEISDRIGWPLRQTKAIVQQLLTKALARLASPRELLVQAQQELKSNRYARAASRLSGWVRHSPGGPPPVGDIELLLNEWKRERLSQVLDNMPVREARTLLKRIDILEQDPAISVERWKDLRARYRHDANIETRLLHRQLLDESQPTAPSANDLLRVARIHADNGLNWRAGIFLRAAAERLPESTGARLELGSRMLEVGMVEDGTPWIIEAARTLIESGHAEKAITPLRAVTSANPANREARKLLGDARGKSARGRRRKKHTLIGLAVVFVLSLGALVHLHLEQDFSKRMLQVTEKMDDPVAALNLLNANFSNADSPRVMQVRSAIEDRIHKQEIGVRQAWLDLFRECHLELTLGDPLLGLQRTLDLPEPPKLSLSDQHYPPLTDLFSSLASRLEKTVSEWRPPEEDDPETVHAEQRMSRMLVDLRAMIEDSGRREDATQLAERLDELEERLEGRGDMRAAERQERLDKDLLQKQDMLLAAARAHSQAGDLERALTTYQSLIDLDDSEKLGRILEPEIAKVRAHQASYEEARGLCEAGDHVSARKLLERTCPRPTEHLLPWRVTSQPSGARARLSDGRTRVTPFTMESVLGHPVELFFELDGYESHRVLSPTPADMKVVMSRVPDRHWVAEGLIEALPVAVGNDHVLADRLGNVVRLSGEGKVLWQKKIQSLGGIARAPIFLPRRPGTLLLLTEDGDAWFLQADSGRMDGPWDMGSPPAEGPVATDREVYALFEDGRTAIWSERLRPEVLANNSGGPAGLFGEDSDGASVGLAFLRRKTAGMETLSSPWTEWTVRVEDGAYVLTKEGDEEAGFTTRQSGEWVFVAWEAPHSKIPEGRLWVSDSEGLRAFELDAKVD